MPSRIDKAPHRLTAATAHTGLLSDRGHHPRQPSDSGRSCCAHRCERDGSDNDSSAHLT